MQFNLNSCIHFNFVLCRILSEDDLHLFEIPEPSKIVSKNDNRSSICSSSAITSETKLPETKTATSNKITLQQTHHQYSLEYLSNCPPHVLNITSNEEKSCLNHFKNIIQKLEIVIRYYLL